MKELELDGKKIPIASQIDAVGLFCPIPIVKLKLALEELQFREVVEVQADDPGFAEDVRAWCMETNNRLLSFLQNEDGTYLAYVEKT